MQPHIVRRSRCLLDRARGALRGAGPLSAPVVAFAAFGPPDAPAAPGWKADAGGGGITGGGLLLMIAYMAIWLAAFGLIVLSLRRQSRMNARIEHLRHELSLAGERATRARKGSSPKKAAAGKGEAAPAAAEAAPAPAKRSAAAEGDGATDESAADEA